MSHLLNRARAGAALLLTMLLMASGATGAQMAPIPTTDSATVRGFAYIKAPRLGITFVSSAQNHASDDRYQRAMELGTGWTRWPLYWNFIEPEPGQYDWENYDRLVIDDTRFGINSLAVLLNRPAFAADGESLVGLNEPIFADGTDEPAPGKPLNPDNLWANFVYAAVDRYKPGGVLARQQGWTGGQGIRHWEMWNEPDLPQFWRGGILNYARLLKVGYLAAKQADAGAVVVFGGLLYNTPDNWLARVLAIYSADPFAPARNWYMDVVAIHSYSDPWRSGWLTLFVDRTLNAYGLQRPIWLTETGVNVWDDYPGPRWTTRADQRLRRASEQQAGWYFIQSAAYAWSEGADVIFFHQLYDDCGDQPPGTDFPPHNGELCVGGATCFGDAFGIFRNPADAACYSQHPRPDSPRTTANAYRLLAQVFGRTPFAPYESDIDGTIIRKSFQRQTDGGGAQLIHVLWNHRYEPTTASLQALGRSALIYTLDGGSRPITPAADGSYTLTLAAAQPDNYPEAGSGFRSAIGGPPVIIVEAVDGLLPTPEPTITPSPPPAAPSTPQRLEPTPGAVPLATLAPEDDITPPTTFVEPLPETSDASFVVNWGAEDDGEIVSYVVWVQEDGGNWRAWLETTLTRSVFNGQPGRTYSFAVWAVDAAGNWSGNVQIAPQATTRVRE